MKTAYRAWPRWARRVTVVVFVLVALTIIVRIVLDPIATHFTRRSLSQMEGMRGDFERVHVTLFRPGYTITRLKLIQHPGGDWKAPLFFAESVHIGVDWRRLLHGELVARARIMEPKITVVSGRARAAATPKAEVKAPDISTQLQHVTPLKVDRVEILRGELLFRDDSQPRRPELWVHRLELAAENLVTREKLAKDRPTTMSAQGVVGRTGDLRLFVSADPFASPLAFAGRFEVVGLRVAELYDFIEPKIKLQTPKGTIDLFAEFRARGGQLEGGVKPVLKNVEVKPAEAGVWDRFKAWLADTGVKLASDRVPGRNAVATVVPIEGRITNPDIQLWPAIFGVLRNAFVEGIASGFSHLPPPEAPSKQGVLSQAKQALTKKEGPPKAQPSESGAKAGAQ